MTILEQIKNSGEKMWKVLKENYWKIIGTTFILFLAIPIIQWGFWSIIYIITQSECILNNFIQATFLDNFIPWYLGIFINFKTSLILFCLLFLLVWIIYSLKD